MTDSPHPTRPPQPEATDPMFPSPHWTLEATVTFDGIRGTATLDIMVSQWFTEKCMDSWSSTTHRIEGCLETLLPDFAAALTETARRVSPF